MNEAMIDIVVPVYNVEAYLRRCLDSILAQTYGCWRAICVDDGSTDESTAILEEFASRDSRFVIIRKPNGGLSDARNVGMEAATAEYLMFVDSDDFIHPQTLELAIGLARRDGSDIVSWYRDALYRNIQVKLLKLLGKDSSKAKPWNWNFRYDINNVDSLVTDDLIGHCSDWNHPDQDKVVKHCYVWRHLFRREAIADVKFIKGLKYEDIPWWSTVILKPLRATITRLPLYYYTPNLDSITKSTDYSVRVLHILHGLGTTFDNYTRDADRRSMQLWSHNIKWAILCGIAGRINVLASRPEAKSVTAKLAELDSGHFFDDALTKRELCAQKVFLSFLKNPSACATL